MNRSTIFSSRLLGLCVGGTAAAAVLFACTLTQSLDYLQKGDGGVSAPIVEAGDGPNVEGGGEAGGRTPVWQVTAQTKPDFLALDAQNVYWIADGKVLTVPKATGGMPKLLGTVPPNASALAVDADPAGFAFVSVGTSVLRVAKDGSSATASVTVFNPGGGATNADTIGADQSSLFVLQYDPNGAGVDARILRMAKDGGAPTDISGDGGATTMTLDPTDLFWLSADPNKSAFIEHAKTAPADTDVAVLTLGANDNLPTLSTEIAVDATNIYWLTIDAASTNAIIVSRKRQPTASAVTIYLGTPDDTLEDIALDDTFVYALDTHGARLFRVAKTGGAPENLLTGLQQPTSLAVDDSGIYVAVAALGTNGQITKIAR